MTSRPKIIVLAPAITKYDVGEAYLAYRLLENLTAKFSITLLTYKLRKRKEEKLNLDCEEIISWDEIPFFYRFERFNSMLKPWYFDFYMKSRRWLKATIKKDASVSLIYQLTPMSVRYPSPAAGLGVPFVVGPVGGSVSDIPSFKSEVVTTQGQWYMRLRGMDRWRLTHDPMLRRTFREASRILVTSPHLYEMFDKVLHHKIITFVEHGIDEALPSGKIDQSIIKLLYVGRVVRTKGLRDAVRALSKIKNTDNYILDVVGDGPDLPEVKKEVFARGLENKVRFHGRLPRTEVDRFYSQADIFLFPSFREATGGVIVEAMSHGVPQICANYGGPAGIVTKKTGVLVNPITPLQFSDDIAQAIKTLAENRTLLASLSAGSLVEAERQYLWPRRGEMLAMHLNAAMKSSYLKAKKSETR